MRNGHGIHLFGLACWFVVSTPAVAGVVALDGIADGDSAYIENPSDTFFRMDLVQPPPNDHQQRFHLISDPSVVIGNPAFDGFPNDSDFRLGNVTFDESALIGGTGTAPISAIELGIGAQPGNPSYINYGRWDDIETTVTDFSGTVELVNDVLVSMSLTSDVMVTAFGGSIVANGNFDVSGEQFVGLIATDSDTPVVWDFSGTLTTVPEPTALSLLAIACVAIVRRRN